MRAIAAAILLAATATMAFGQQVPFDLAVRRLKAPDASVRRAALQMLVESGYPEAAVPIAGLLADPDDKLQREAVYAELGLFLGTRVQTKPQVQPAAGWFDQGLASLPIAPVPAEVVTGLIGPTRHQDLAFRIEVIYALGILAQVDGTPPAPEHAAVAEALAERFGDTAAPVRVAAARAAGRVFGRCAAPCDAHGIERLGSALTYAVNDPDPDVRFAAIEALGDMRWAPAVAPLMAGYERQKKGVDALANIAALARIGHLSASPVFHAALSRKETVFQLAGAEGLARIGGQEAEFAASTLAAAKPRQLQVVRAFAAARAGDQQAISALVQALNDSTSRIQARDYLLELGKAAAAAAAAAAGSANTGARLALAEILSAVGGAAELPAVESLRNDKDGSVAAAAGRAAMRIAARMPQ
jgi:HEAT repeat protein